MKSTTEEVKTIVEAVWRGECRLLGKDYVKSAIAAADTGQSEKDFVKKIAAAGDSFDLYKRLRRLSSRRLFSLVPL
jgi:hypothetical protein